MNLTKAMGPELRRRGEKYGCEHMKQLKITKREKIV